MPIITLTTDFGEKDHYAGAVKGTIYSELDTVKIVDISHSIQPFHISEAAYVIRNAYLSFPRGTIHVIGIDAEITPENKHIAAFLDGHYFICADNGILSLIMTDLRPERLVEINIHDRVSGNSPVLDVFAKVACHLARGGALEVIGKKTTRIKELRGITAVVSNDKKRIMGSVIYIDNYGNVVSNITREQFEQVGAGRKYTISAGSAKFRKVVDTYGEAIDFSLPAEKREEDGKKIALWNASGYLELAIYKSNPRTVGSASTLFGLDYRDNINVQFE